MLRMASAGIEHRWASTSSNEAPAARQPAGPSCRRSRTAAATTATSAATTAAPAVWCTGSAQAEGAGCRGPIRNAKRVEKAVFDAGRFGRVARRIGRRRRQRRLVGRRRRRRRWRRRRWRRRRRRRRRRHRRRWRRHRRRRRRRRRQRRRRRCRGGAGGDGGGGGLGSSFTTAGNDGGGAGRRRRRRRRWRRRWSNGERRRRAGPARVPANDREHELAAAALAGGHKPFLLSGPGIGPTGTSRPGRALRTSGAPPRPLGFAPRLLLATAVSPPATAWCTPCRSLLHLHLWKVDRRLVHAVAVVVEGRVLPT